VEARSPGRRSNLENARRRRLVTGQRATFTCDICRAMSSPGFHSAREGAARWPSCHTSQSGPFYPGWQLYPMAPRNSDQLSDRLPVRSRRWREAAGLGWAKPPSFCHRHRPPHRRPPACESLGGGYPTVPRSIELLGLPPPETGRWRRWHDRMHSAYVPRGSCLPEGVPSSIRPSSGHCESPGAEPVDHLFALPYPT